MENTPQTELKPAAPVPAKGSGVASMLETILKILTPLIAIAGLLIGIWEFSSQQRENDRMEFKRRIWEKRLNAYTDIADILSKIVTETNTVKSDSLSRIFNQLYWGKLPLFEDKLVEKSMKNFQELLEDAKDNIEDVNNRNLLKKAAFKVVSNCQTSIHESWNELSR